jgi:hypothetical protein
MGNGCKAGPKAEKVLPGMPHRSTYLFDNLQEDLLVEFSVVFQATLIEPSLVCPAIAIAGPLLQQNAIDFADRFFPQSVFEQAT